MIYDGRSTLITLVGQDRVAVYPGYTRKLTDLFAVNCPPKKRKASSVLPDQEDAKPKRPQIMVRTPPLVGLIPAGELTTNPQESPAHRGRGGHRLSWKKEQSIWWTLFEKWVTQSKKAKMRPGALQNANLPAISQQQSYLHDMRQVHVPSVWAEVSRILFISSLNTDRAKEAYEAAFSALWLHLPSMPQKLWQQEMWCCDAKDEGAIACGTVFN